MDRGDVFRFVAQILGEKTIDFPGLKQIPFNYSTNMSVCYITFPSFPFIAQNLGNRAETRDHDPPGYWIVTSKDLTLSCETLDFGGVGFMLQYKKVLLTRHQII